MRILVILRGAPGSGKSTFVEVMGLSPYTISSDQLRMQLSALKLDPMTGELGIDMAQETQEEVWKEFYRLVELRMKNGDLIVVDATHCRKRGFTRYRSLCQQYRYRAFVVDFSAVPVEACLANNLLRPGYKKVPEEVISTFHRFSTRKSELPGNWCSVIKAEVPTSFSADKFQTLPQAAFQKAIQWRRVDANRYDKIHYIGDLQGCHAPLECYFRNHGSPVEKPNELFIFVGDLLDRGIENHLVLRLLMAVAERENVVIIEGNHDTILNRWAHSEPVGSREFTKSTLPQLLKHLVKPSTTPIPATPAPVEGETAAARTPSNIEAKEDPGVEQLKKEVRMFFRKFHQLHYHGFRVDGEEEEREVLVTHGGLPCIPSNLSLISQKELIHGSGEFDFPIDESFAKNCKPNQYQLHGHRNPSLLPCKVNEHSFNLEAAVEYGGFLRIVTLDHKNGFQVHEIKNNVSRFLHLAPQASRPPAVEFEKAPGADDMECLNLVFLSHLRGNSFVREKKMTVPLQEQKEEAEETKASEAEVGTWAPIEISSFNFTEQAFNRRVWNAQTIKARGLFVDRNTNRVVARSYDKFFNVDEVPSVEQAAIPVIAKLPLTVYVKENGYLGVASGLKFTRTKATGEVETRYQLLTCSKSTCEGPFAEEFRRLMKKHLQWKGIKEETLAKELHDRNASLVFEVVSPDFDKHVIEYKREVIFLLDVVENHLNRFVRYDTEQREALAATFGFEAKKFFKKIETWEEWAQWFKLVSDGNDDACKLPDGTDIEGFVVEDATTQYMFKIKLSFYRLWKQARGIKDQLARGGKVNMKNVRDKELKEFVQWMMTLDKNELKTDIITLRNSWKASLVLQPGEEEEEAGEDSAEGKKQSTTGDGAKKKSFNQRKK